MPPRKRAAPSPSKGRPKKKVKLEPKIEPETIDLDLDDSEEEPLPQNCVADVALKVKNADSSPLLDSDGGLRWADGVVSTMPLGELCSKLKGMADGVGRLGLPVTSDLKTLYASCAGVVDVRTGKGKGKGSRGKKASAQDKAADERRRDDAAVVALRGVIGYVKDLPRNTSGEILVPVYPEFAVLVGGGLFDSLRSLFRNDSLMDISSRSSLYHYACELVDLASQSAALAAVLMYRPAAETPAEDATPSIVDLLKTIGKQADVYLAKAVRMGGGDMDIHDSSEGLAASDMAMSLRDAVSNIMKNVEGKAVVAADSGGSREREYEAAMRDDKLRVLSLASGDGSYPHAYKRDIASASASHQATVKIMKEMSTLSTNLPVHYHSSIFVCADEGRSEVMKALIVGPANTPYENACFTFDILLPPTYPALPPKVTATTTLGGRVRMNPNLYANGKVCLSLLGTWSGPGWCPKSSTLLQVLLSIQGLILVPDPFFNEPAYDPPDLRAARFNEYIRLFSCRAGIVDMIAQPDPVFKDIIHRHFRLKRDSIKAQVKKWLSKENTKGVTTAPPLEFGFPRGAYGFATTDADRYSPASVLKKTLEALDSL